LILVCTVALLLPVFGSGVPVLTLAVFVTEPPRLSRLPTIVTVTDSPIFSVPMVQVTVLVLLQLPFVERVEVNRTLTG
jgi:hypothetical protein